MNPPTANDGAGLRALRPWLLAALVLAVAAAAALRFWPAAKRGRYEALGLIAGLTVLLRQLSGPILVAALVTYLLLEEDRDVEGYAAGRPLMARATAAVVLLALGLYLL